MNDIEVRNVIAPESVLRSVFVDEYVRYDGAFSRNGLRHVRFTNSAGELFVIQHSTLDPESVGRFGQPIVYQLSGTLAEEFERTSIYRAESWHKLLTSVRLLQVIVPE